MSDSDAPVEPSPGFHINFSDHMPAEQRRLAEQSVAAHIAHVTEPRARQRAAAASQAEAAAAINAPLVRIIEADPTAAKALADAGDRRREFMHLLEVEPPEFPKVRDLPIDIGILVNDGVADQVFAIPYHFDWRWHRGAAGTSNANRLTGEISVGTTIEDDDEFSDVHAGVGVSLTTTDLRRVKARSLRSSWDHYLVSAGGFGGDATAEGGMEMTILEDGQLLSAAQDKRFRKRVSNSETDHFDTGGFGTGDSIEVGCLMAPGRAYTLNVGAWVYCEQHSGFGFGGSSGANAKVVAKVIVMTLFDFN